MFEFSHASVKGIGASQPVPARVKLRTLTDCFAHFGIEVTAPRSAWTGRAPDGRVVLTLWLDQFDDPTTLAHYTTKHRADLNSWVNRPQNKKRRDLLKDIGIGNLFYSILIAADDPKSATRRTIARQIGPRMRLTDLNEATGEFSAERDD